jgi:hypothetical protein
MADWFNTINARRELSAGALQDLQEEGFGVISGPVAPGRLARLAEAYDSAVLGAASTDVSIGSSTTRVHDFVNRGAEFDGLYIYEPILSDHHPQRPYEGSVCELRGPSSRVRARGLSSCLQRVRLARTHSKSVGRASAFNTRRVYPPRYRAGGQPGCADTSRDAWSHW